ncbi:MAG: GTPase HflX, partial [Gemmatimonadaceae bacterium]
GLQEAPVLLVFNKIDALATEELLALQARVTAMAHDAIFVSATSDGGLDPLRRSLQAAIRARRPLSEIRLSPSDGRLLAAIHREGEVVDQRTDGDWMVVRARVDDALAGRLRSAGAEVVLV